MTRSKIELIICAVLLTAIFGLSLALRIAIPWDHVFAGQWIKLTDNDAYYYVRLLDNLSSHFPLLSQFDPYSIFPAGKNLAGQPLFFVYFMGFFTWLMGGAAQSRHIVDLVAVYFPAVAGALLVVPVFFIGRTIFNKWAGLTAALFIALIPGEFLVRTLLGNADIHIMEILFSTMFMLFLVLATSSGKNLLLYPPQKVSRHSLIMPIIYSLLAGLCLGIYILSWEGALFFVFISFVWLVVQLIINHLKGLSVGYLGLTGCTCYLAALLLTLAAPPGLMTYLALAAAIAASAVLPLISWYMQGKKFNRVYFPVAIIALAAAAIVAIYLVMPSLLKGMATVLAGFFMWRPDVTIAESQPLLINQGSFTLALLWGNFTAGSIMALAALCILIFQVYKKGTPEITLLVVWSILTLLAALAMRRFAYYFAINVALLSGYFGWLILQASGFKDKIETTVTASIARAGRKKAKSGGTASMKVPGRANPALMALGAAAVALLAIYPNTGPLPGGDKPIFDVATRALYTPGNAWYESLDWMRNNTPDPFGDAGYYYDYYSKQTAPSPAYSVVCWWDYGYWVTQIGHRVPFSNPGSAQRGEQYLLMAQDNAEADKVINGWKMKYLVLNDYLADWTKGFSTISSDALQPLSKYYEIYYRSQNGKLSPTLLYYPEYYQTMSVRLYCFDGKQYTPTETAVISWENKTGTDGKPYKEITGLKTTKNYAAATAFLNSPEGANWRIVGKDPNVSPVPLEALDKYKPAYSSSQKSKFGTTEIPEVKIFEYSGSQ